MSLLSHSPSPASQTGSVFPHKSTLVLGVGKVVAGDDGAGARAIQSLRTYPWPRYVELVDAGNAGVALLERIRNAHHVILIDATHDGRTPGTVSHFRVTMPSDLPAALGEHDTRLEELFMAAAWLGPLPGIDLVTVSVENPATKATDLSAEVAAALPEIEKVVRQLID